MYRIATSIIALIILAAMPVLAETSTGTPTDIIPVPQHIETADGVYSWRDEHWKEEAARDWNTRTQCPECEKKQKIIDDIAHHLGEILISMQAAYVEMCNTSTDNAMLWIENTLYEKGLIPSVTKWTTAQDFFDSEIAKLEERTKNE